MATLVQICNMALTHVGRAPVNAVTEASPEARELNRHYALARDTLLQSHDWKFARRRQPLARLNTDEYTNVVDDPEGYLGPPTDEERQVQGPWLYSFSFPVRALRILQVNDVDVSEKYGAPYEIIGRVIYTNVETTYLTYTSMISDTEEFPPLFVDALTYGIAARVAYPLTREAKIRNDMLALYDQARTVAMVWDMNLTETVIDHVSEFIEARD